MSIQETQRKIHFVPFDGRRGRPKDDSPSPTLSINRKYGMVTFSKAIINELGLEGKFVHLYYEPTRKIIGFQVKTSVNQSLMKQWKMVKKNPTTGVWKATITKILGEFRGLTRESYLDLPVKKYVEKDDLLNRGEVFYYVQLVEDPEELKKGVGNDMLEGAKVK